jgi:membrane protease YdiL (CAAX protease family)
VRHWAPVAGLVALLAFSNVVANRLLPDPLYMPWNLSVAGLVLFIGVRLDGRSLDEIGLSRAKLGNGLRLGGVVVGLTALVYLLGAVLPFTRDLYDDARVEGSGLAATLYDVLIRVPLGTVVLEELAFRGVLPALLAVRVGTPRAVAVSCGLFGLWHVLPSTGLADRNPVAEDVFGHASVVLPVAFAVASTALAGFVLWLLRRWSGSLAAPALTHWSTNGLGYLLAYFI